MRVRKMMKSKQEILLLVGSIDGSGSIYVDQICELKKKKKTLNEINDCILFFLSMFIDLI